MNPYGVAIKKYLIEAIPNRYTESIDDTVDRLVHSLATKKDAENLIKLMGELYQAGFDKAIQGMDKAIQAQGMKLKIVPPKRD